MLKPEGDGPGGFGWTEFDRDPARPSRSARPPRARVTTRWTYPSGRRPYKTQDVSSGATATRTHGVRSLLTTRIFLPTNTRQSHAIQQCYYTSHQFHVVCSDNTHRGDELLWPPAALLLTDARRCVRGLRNVERPAVAVVTGLRRGVLRSGGSPPADAP